MKTEQTKVEKTKDILKFVNEIKRKHGVVNGIIPAENLKQFDKEIDLALRGFSEREEIPLYKFDSEIWDSIDIYTDLDILYQNGELEEPINEDNPRGSGSYFIGPTDETD